MSAMMRAVVIDEPGGPEALRMIEAEIPDPGAKELRITMAGACVNPVDIGTRSGLYHGRWFTGTPRIGLGWDVAGVVSAVGAEVTGFDVGDRVLALDDRFSRPLRCYAEEVVVPASAAGQVPDRLDLVTASTIPMNGSTAAESLEALDLSPGATLLVTGAAAAVGGFAVSLAARAGIEVTGLAAAKDAELVRGVGAAHVVARGTSYDEIGPYDAVLDAAMVGAPAIAAVRDGGRFVAVSPSKAPPQERGITVHVVLSRPIGSRIEWLAGLAAGNELHPRVAGTLPLAEAAEAHRRFESEITRARWVLVP